MKAELNNVIPSGKALYRGRWISLEDALTAWGRSHRKAINTVLDNPAVESIFTKDYRWERKTLSDGTIRYDVYDVEVLEPHTFMGDVFDAKRIKSIFNRTIARYPRGKVFVGHNSPFGTENFQVGESASYRLTKMSRILCCFADLEPETFLDIALGRLRGRSVELHWPGLDYIEGVALLGSSRQFFHYPDLKVSLTEDEMTQLREDVSRHPQNAKRKKFQLSGATQRQRLSRRLGMNKEYRQVGGPNGSLIHQVRERKAEGEGWGEWRPLRQGEEGKKDDVSDQLSELRASMDEIIGRQQALEDKLEEMESSGRAQDDDDDDDDKRQDDDDDDKKKKDDDDRADHGDDDDKEKERKRKESEMAKRTKLDKRMAAVEDAQAEAISAAIRSTYNHKLDELVTGGAVIASETRSAVLDAVLVMPEDKRSSTFDSLTKSIRSVSMKDDEGTSTPKDGDTELAEGMDPDEIVYRNFLRGMKAHKGYDPKHQKQARELGKEYDEIKDSGYDQESIRGGKAAYCAANMFDLFHNDPARAQAIAMKFLAA